MNVVFKSSFLRDVKKIRMQHTLDQIETAIETAERSNHITEIPGVKQIKGAKNHYRVRIGTYRIGIAVEAEILYFVRCLPRKDIYKLFP